MELVAPATDSAPVTARLQGFWVTTGWPVVVGSSVDGNEIRIDLLASSSGPAVITEYERFVDLGVLHAGVYDLYADLDVDVGTPFEASLVCGPVAVVVSTAQPVPLGPEALMLLIAILGGSGCWFSRRAPQ